MTDLKNINDANMSLNESDLLHVMLYGSKNFDNNMKISILTATIKFIPWSMPLLFFSKKSVVLQLRFLP